MLKFAYKPGSLRIDCNERGFDANDIEAICTIRQSTKAGRIGYTGEKGIGFKSVFRVANVVWISSGSYSFKFDKNQKFGLIAPLWAEFPEPVQQGYTSFYLELSSAFNEKELVESLMKFDAAQLVFLRRLRHIELQVAQQNGQLWTQNIHRKDTFESDHPMSILEIGESKLEYLVQRYRVESLPAETKRPGRTESELVSAFPVLSHVTEPPSDTQMVYAGLPISDTHGLKVYSLAPFGKLETNTDAQFLLHGDFLLTTSRLHIDTSLPWNQALRDGLAEALLQAVDSFNDCSLRYFWPFFISSGDRVSDFFEPAMTAILEKLRTRALLESSAKTLVNPSDLIYVDPERFVNVDGRPFTLCRRTATYYLSSNYPSWTIASIKSLGVRTLSDREFLEHLKTMISDDTSWFRSRPPQWHASLAKTLMSLMQHHELRGALLELPVIPLSSGEWASGSDQPKPILMSDKAQLADLSVSNALPIVEAKASADRARRDLFLGLDIMPIETGQLCEYICEQHASISFRPYEWTKAQLIAHTRLLHESCWAPTDNNIDLWFATSDGKRCKGSQLYIPRDLTRSSTAARVLGRLLVRFPSIHPDYLTSTTNGEDESDFLSYLTNRLQASQIPRLVTFDPTTKGFQLSEDFKYLLTECSLADTIHVLHGNWRCYSEWLEPDASKDQPPEIAEMRNRLVREIGDTIVRTSHGPLPLRDTFLPKLDKFIEDTILPRLANK